jgi:ribosomal-protein-serine acetyltransferase
MASARAVFRWPVDGDLALGLLLPRHAGALFALVDPNRDHLRPWLPWVDRTLRVEDSLAFIRSALQQLARHEGFHLGLWWGRELTGVLGVPWMDGANGRAGLGYWLGAAFQGRGLMTRSVAALLDFLFDEWGLHRVQIRAAVANARSRAVPERLGFRLEGVLRGVERLSDGRRADHALYAILAEEWRAARNTR